MATSLFSPTSGAVRPPRSIAAAFGLWDATRVVAGTSGVRAFASATDVEAAVSHGAIPLRAPIRVRLGPRERVDTTAARVQLAGALHVRLPFSLLNRALDVTARAHLLETAADLRGVHVAEGVEDDLDRFGLAFARRSGASIAAGDLRAPPDEPEILAAAREAVRETQRRYDKGDITDGERYNAFVDTWADAAFRSEGAVERRAHPDHPLGALRAAGLLTSADARRCVAMVGLASKPWGEIIELPVVHGFAEGLGAHEHFLTSTTTRERAVGRHLGERTAQRLHERISAALGELRVTEIDCRASQGRTLTAATRKRRVLVSLRDRALGRTALTDVWSPDGVRLLRGGAPVSGDAAERLHEHVVTSVAIRSLLDCAARDGVCQRCYGWDPRTRRPVGLGARVGLLAARAIAEAGPALVEQSVVISGAVYMPSPCWLGPPTRHAGVARWRRIEAEPCADGDGFVMMGEAGRLDLLDEAGAELESFAVQRGDHIVVADGARVPAGAGVVDYPRYDCTLILADVPRGATATVRTTSANGAVDEATEHEALCLEVRLADGTRLSLPVPLPPGAWREVCGGEAVERGDLLARVRLTPFPEREDESCSGLPRLVELLEVARPSPRAVVAEVDGVVRVVERAVPGRRGALLRIVPDRGGRPRDHRVHPYDWAVAVDDDHVLAGERLTGVRADHRDLMRAVGQRRYADHLLHELFALFADSRIPIAAQHLELVVREMVRHDRIDAPGGTALAAGSVVPRAAVAAENAAARARGARTASSSPVLLGIGELARLRAAAK